MTNTTKNTTAYVAQSIASFGIALTVVIVGEVNLPVAGWTRAFLGLGTVFLVSSCFTLAKCIRDQQETESVVSRIDQARIERMMAEFDPYRVPTPGDPAAPRAFG
ncbi:MAG TPA: YiaA/YiaB family inner membrane protein [Jatrophihabitans sp.]|jgi:hypothetical protein|uniref:YiaA/YiaB family inner membrane protein n=1 Tax=Jatrophihabitans sp. TaxID=1932789 RepID=UPI002E034EE0|nr:YiaA/YiaB family inner membrane protein [Jatrophihabitans sp.]